MVRRQRPRYGIRWWVTQFCADRPQTASPSISFREAMISRAAGGGKGWMMVGCASQTYIFFVPHPFEIRTFFTEILELLPRARTEPDRTRCLRRRSCPVRSQRWSFLYRRRGVAKRNRLRGAAVRLGNRGLFRCASHPYARKDKAIQWLRFAGA